MEVLIHKYFKNKNNNIVVIVRDLGFFTTRLISKPTKAIASEAIALEIVKDFYQEEDLTIKFVDDPDAMDEISLTYYETCYGWDL